MKEEKEFLWIIRLLNSKLIKSLFNKKDGCKKDFERIAGAPENSYEFNIWLDFLISEKCIEINGFRSIGRSGKKVNTYVINYPKLIKRLKSLDLYKLSKKIMLMEEFGLKD